MTEDDVHTSVADHNENPDGARHVPLGPGVVIRQLLMHSTKDALYLRALLSGYDGLASAHGDETGVVVLLTTTDREAELDEWLAEVRKEIDFTILAV